MYVNATFGAGLSVENSYLSFLFSNMSGKRPSTNVQRAAAGTAARPMEQNFHQLAEALRAALSSAGITPELLQRAQQGAAEVAPAPPPIVISSREVSEAIAVGFLSKHGVRFLVFTVVDRF